MMMPAQASSGQQFHRRSCEAGRRYPPEPRPSPWIDAARLALHVPGFNASRTEASTTTHCRQSSPLSAVGLVSACSLLPSRLFKSFSLLSTPSRTHDLSHRRRRCPNDALSIAAAE